MGAGGSGEHRQQLWRTGNHFHAGGGDLHQILDQRHCRSLERRGYSHISVLLLQSSRRSWIRSIAGAYCTAFRYPDTLKIPSYWYTRMGISGLRF